jgi:hypothetical protein
MRFLLAKMSRERAHAGKAAVNPKARRPAATIYSVAANPLHVAVSQRRIKFVPGKGGERDMDDWWYVAKDERQGPVNSDDLHRLLRDGTLTSEALVWKRGMKDWQPAAHVEQLGTFLQSLPPEIPRVEHISKQSSGKHINVRAVVHNLIWGQDSVEQLGFLPIWWQQTRKHLGSTLAFAFGLASLAHVAGDPQGRAWIEGVAMTLGALAYWSAKKRRLGEVKTTLTRQCLEVALIVLICLAILLQNDLIYRIESDPVPNFIVPLWAIVAYLVIVFVPSSLLQRRASPFGSNLVADRRPGSSSK